MVKKPKLSDALASYTKKQAEKAKEQRRNEAIEAMNKNKAKKTSSTAQGSGATEPQAKSVVNDHVPCHIWTDADKMQQRTKLPFHPKNNSIVLLIGEGDFSYCRALVNHFLSTEKNLAAASADEEAVVRKWRVVATALDGRETVLRKYRKARDNLAFLEETENVETVFGVDGTKLHEDRELKRIFGANDRPPTRIIFNFPHTGAGIKDRERNIVAQQKMLQGFFDSVLKFVQMRGITSGGCTYTTTMIKKDYTIKEEVLKRKLPKLTKKGGSDDEESDDEIIITDVELLANDAKILKDHDESAHFDEKDRGESFEVHCTFKTGEPYDAWKPKALATRTNQLACLQTFKFCPELYQGYQHCRTIGDKGEGVVEVEGWKEFLAGKPAKTFVFSLKK